MKTYQGLLVFVCLVGGAVLSEAAWAASAKDMVGSGDGFYMRKEYDFAAEEYTSFLAKFPDDAEAPRARFQLGQCYYELKQYGKAAAAYAELVDKNAPEQLLAKGLYRLGECEAKLAHWDKAAAAYGQLFEKAPTNTLAPGALWGQSEALYALKKYSESAAACEQLIAKFPDSEKYAPLGWYSLGWARFEQKDYAGAATAFETVVAKYPKEAIAAQSQLKIGECRFEQKDYQKALVAYQAVVEKFPGEWSDEALLGAGNCQFALKAYDAAAGAFGSVAEKYPKEPAAPLALLNAARSYLEAGKPEKALEAADKFDAAYAGTKTAPQMTAERGRALLELKKHAEAAQQFAAAIKAGLPEDEQPAAHFRLGEALFGAKKFKEALTAYVEVLTKFKTHKLAEDATYLVIFCQAELGDTATAAEQCETFARAYPQSRLLASVKQVEGEYLFRMKKYAEARGACLASLEQDAKGQYADDAMYKLAWSYRELGDNAKAEEQFVKLASSFPESPFAAEGLYMAGEAAASQDKATEAAQHLDACRQKFPESKFAANAAYRLALLRYDKQDFKAAAKSFGDFIAKYPDNALMAQALVFAGESEFQLGNYDEARGLYERQLKEHGEDGRKWADVALHGIAWCDRKQGKMGAAAAGFAKLVAEHGESKLAAQSAYWVARSLEEDKKYAEAAAGFAAFLEKYPKHELAEQAGYRVGAAEYEAGNHARAAAVFLTFIAGNPKSQFADNATYDLAWCYKTTGEPDKAMATYAKLVADYPDSDVLPHALFELGNLLYDAKKYKEAISRYEESAARKTKELLDKTYYKLGLAYTQDEAPAKAAEVFAKLIAECPQSPYAPEAQYRLGRALQLEGKEAEAVVAFKKAIDAKPGEQLTELAMFYTAESYRSQKNWAKGLDAYKAAIEAFPKSALINEMIYGKGVCAQNLGAYADAVEAYKAVIAATGTETAARAQYGLAECSMLQGNFSDAMKEFMRIEILYGFDEWCAAGLYMAGQCAEKSKDPDRAAKFYQSVLDNEKYKATSYGPKAQAGLEELGKNKK